MKANQIGTKWSGVYNPPILTKEDEIKCCRQFISTLSLIGCKYWAIIHDMDKNEDGTEKRIHVHFVLQTARRNWSAVLHQCEELASKIAPEPLVQLDKVANLEGVLRYLTHQDNLDKYQYDSEDVDTNAKDDYIRAFKGEMEELTGEGLINLVVSSNFDRVAILMALGPSKYCQFEKAITMIIKDMR